MPVLTYAQVGYLGKRLSIQYAPTLGNPWLQNFFDDSRLDTDNAGYIQEYAKHNYPSYPRYNAPNHNKKSLFINIKHRLMLDYTISARSTIGFGYHLARYGYYARDLFQANADSTRFTQVESSGNIEGKDMVLRFTRFSQETAPIGSYFTISIGKHSSQHYITMKDISGRFRERTEEHIFVGLDVGKNILIGNGLFLNVGAAIQYSSAYKDIKNYRITTFNIFRPTVGIGYIPF